jgi:hypothetical protein
MQMFRLAACRPSILTSPLPHAAVHMLATGMQPEYRTRKNSSGHFYPSSIPIVAAPSGRQHVRVVLLRVAEPRRHCKPLRTARPNLVPNAVHVSMMWRDALTARDRHPEAISRDQKQKPLAAYKLGCMRLSG